MYTGGPRGKKDNEASHINNRSSTLTVFHLYFAEIITLLVVQTNHYYHDYIDRLDNGPSPEPDVSEAKMFVSGTDNTDGTWRERQTDRLLGNSRPAVHTFLQHYNEMGLLTSHP